MSLPAAERTTVISFDDSSALAFVSTYNAALIRSLRSNPSADLNSTGGTDGTDWADFTIPKALIAFRVKRRAKPPTELERSARQAELELRMQ